MRKYCRICWNTANWRQPTGEARNLESGNSYVAKYGFGHEEWLFNLGWVLSGYQANDPATYRYGFLQPISKYRESYKGQSGSICLYTITPSGNRVIVAIIENVYVPYDKELEWVLNKTTENGWLYAMQRDLDNLDIPITQLLNPSPSWIANIRFRSEDIRFRDPWLAVPNNHVIARNNRYHPYDWLDRFPPTGAVPYPVQITEPEEESEDFRRRAEGDRQRAAVAGTTYDPRHARLQNALYDFLRTQHGNKSVHGEREFVDISLSIDNHVTYIEIKMNLTVKSCIRPALGQLLEYAHYPNLMKANDLLVVGDVPATDEDIAYLAHLRDTYGLPVHYAQWSWTERRLGDWV